MRCVAVSPMPPKLAITIRRARIVCSRCTLERDVVRACGCKGEADKHHPPDEVTLMRRHLHLLRISPALSHACRALRAPSDSRCDRSRQINPAAQHRAAGYRARRWPLVRDTARQGRRGPDRSHTQAAAQSCVLPLPRRSRVAGGDEFFGGYNSYLGDLLNLQYQKVPLAIRKMIYFCVAHAVPTIKHPMEDKFKRFCLGSLMEPLKAHYYWQNRTLLDKQRDVLYSSDFLNSLSQSDSYHAFLDLKNHSHFRNLLDLFMYIDQSMCLPNAILSKVDRMSMAYGIEVRCPLLDLDVIKVSYQIPLRLKVSLRSRKYILRRLLHSMLPQNLILKRKKGFGIPVNHWLRSELKDFMCDAVLSESFLSLGFFNRQGLQRIVNEHIKKKRQHGSILWSLMIFAVWHRQQLMK